jgi:hypothetical protein
VLTKIAKWLKYNPRNRLIFTPDKISELNFVDIGYALSAKIKDYVDSPRLAMIAQDELNRILRSAISHNNIIGDYVAISNWGILFEEALSFNIADIFASVSQTKVLIAQNTGRVADGKFYLSYPNRQYSFNLNNIQYYPLD